MEKATIRGTGPDVEPTMKGSFLYCAISTDLTPPDPAAVAVSTPAMAAEMALGG